MAPMDERRRIGLLYSWMINEYELPAFVVAVIFLGLFLGVLWLLRLLCLGRGPGRWAGEVLERYRARRLEQGNCFGRPPTYWWHQRQVLSFQALYLAFVLCTCGVGLLIGGPFYIVWFMRARREAEAGGWPRLPIVGRWQPEPPTP